MIKLTNILQHYEKAEEKFVRKVYNDLEDVKFNFIEKHFGFLEPNELSIVKQLASLFEVDLFVDDMYDSGEFKYVIAYLETFGYTPEADLLIYELKYNRKFNRLSHRQIMGTLYNAGFDSKLIGDIVVDADGRVQFVLARELADALRISVFKYANVKVEYEEVDYISIEPMPMKRNIYSARSLRLDSICKMLSGVSRTKMSKVVLKGDVRVNFKVIVDTNFLVSEGDLISIRGVGRFIIVKMVKVNQKYNIVYDAHM